MACVVFSCIIPIVFVRRKKILSVCPLVYGVFYIWLKLVLIVCKCKKRTQTLIFLCFLIDTVQKRIDGCHGMVHSFVINTVMNEFALAIGFYQAHNS